jgi:hypothetical protein
MRTMTPTRIASLAVALAASAGSPVLAVASDGGGSVKSGDYSGTVGPGYPISFRVSANGAAVEGLVVGFDETCNGAPSLTAPLFHFKTLQIKAGKFSGASVDRFGKTVSDALRISGSFSGHQAMGKVTDESKIKSLRSCSQSEPFTAKSK